MSSNLVLVLAVITMAVAALAYEWCHALAVKSHHTASLPHHSPPIDVVKPAAH